MIGFTVNSWIGDSGTGHASGVCKNDQRDQRKGKKYGKLIKRQNARMRTKTLSGVKISM